MADTVVRHASARRLMSFERGAGDEKNNSLVFELTSGATDWSPSGIMMRDAHPFNFCRLPHSCVHTMGILGSLAADFTQIGTLNELDIKLAEKNVQSFAPPALLNFLGQLPRGPAAYGCLTRLRLCGACCSGRAPDSEDNYALAEALLDGCMPKLICLRLRNASVTPSFIVGLAAALRTRYRLRDVSLEGREPLLAVPMAALLDEVPVTGGPPARVADHLDRLRGGSPEERGTAKLLSRLWDRGLRIVGAHKEGRKARPWHAQSRGEVYENGDTGGEHLRYLEALDLGKTPLSVEALAVITEALEAGRLPLLALVDIGRPWYVAPPGLEAVFAAQEGVAAEMHRATRVELGRLLRKNVRDSAAFVERNPEIQRSIELVHNGRLHELNSGWISTAWAAAVSRPRPVRCNTEFDANGFVKERTDTLPA